MKTATKFVADDNTEFATREECEAHEEALIEQKLVGLTLDQVKSALARTDVDLAKAIEAIGNRITKARIEAGDKRVRKPKDAAVTSPPQPATARKRVGANAGAAP